MTHEVSEVEAPEVGRRADESAENADLSHGGWGRIGRPRRLPFGVGPDLRSVERRVISDTRCPRPPDRYHLALEFLDTIKKGLALPRTQPQTASSYPEAGSDTSIALLIVGGLFVGIDFAVFTRLAQKARRLPAVQADAPDRELAAGSAARRRGIKRGGQDESGAWRRCRLRWLAVIPIQPQAYRAQGCRFTERWATFDGNSGYIADGDQQTRAVAR